MEASTPRQFKKSLSPVFRRWTLPNSSFLQNFKGPPIGPLVDTWRVVSGSFKYKITMISVRQHTTKFHHF